MSDGAHDSPRGVVQAHLDGRINEIKRLDLELEVALTKKREWFAKWKQAMTERDEARDALVAKSKDHLEEVARREEVEGRLLRLRNRLSDDNTMIIERKEWDLLKAEAGEYRVRLAKIAGISVTAIKPELLGSPARTALEEAFHEIGEDHKAQHELMERVNKLVSENADLRATLCAHGVVLDEEDP